MKFLCKCPISTYVNMSVGRGETLNIYFTREATGKRHMALLKHSKFFYQKQKIEIFKYLNILSIKILLKILALGESRLFFLQIKLRARPG